MADHTEADPTERAERTERSERADDPCAATPLRVLGLDPGSRRLGYAVVDVHRRGQFSYRECGILSAPDTLPVASRLLELARDLRAVIRELRPAVAAVEDVFHHRNARSALVLGQARGVALLCVAEHDLQVCSYPPATVKKTICGNGRAPKEQIQLMVASLAGLARPPASDAADALALAICHCLHLPAPAGWHPTGAPR